MSNKLLNICPELNLPLDIITMRTATYGDSGAGKTTFGRLLGEKVHEAGQRFCAIDLKNDWWGFKSSADGAAAGLPVVIFGGPRGDVKLFEDAAAARTLAETVASIDQSVILDLDAMSRAKQERFLTAFLDTFYEVNRRPVLLFCDEADRYAPQKPMTQDAIMSLSSSEDIARRGRKRGIGSFWLTQRTAVLNKNVSEFCNMTVIFRTPGERDLKELEERVGRISNKETVKEVMRLAPGLADGQAFFLSSHPKLRKFLPDPVRPIQLPLPWTFDSSATPGIGQRRREPKVLASTDLAAIEQRMALVVADTKANDPKLLKAELAKAQAELKKLQAAPAPLAKVQTKTRTVEKFLLKDQQIARVEKLGQKIEAIFKDFSSQVDQFRAAAAKLVQPSPPPLQPVFQSRSLPPVSRIVPVISKPARKFHESPPGSTPPPDSNGDSHVGRDGLRRILTALAQRNDLTNSQIAIRAGMSKKGGSFRTYMSRARVHGWITDHGDRRHITEAGLSALGEFDPLPSGEGLLRHWLAEFGDSRAAQILKAHAAAYPNGMSKEEIEAATGLSATGGSFRTYMSRLRVLELIAPAGPRRTRASDELFAE